MEHKVLPSEPKPQSAVPTQFLEAVEHPQSSAAKDLKKTLEPLDAVNQIGRGPNKQTELALTQPIKVIRSFFFHITCAET